MGVPTSEVGYTPAMPRREDHEVHKDMWWHWTTKKVIKPANHRNKAKICNCNIMTPIDVSRKGHRNRPYAKGIGIFKQVSGTRFNLKQVRKFSQIVSFLAP